MPSDTTERDSRGVYELALIEEARLRGTPTLAVCGGSWRLLEDFEGRVETLSEEGQQTHLGKLGGQAHGIELRPKTFLGGTGPMLTGKKARKGTIDRVNSTHWAVASTTSDKKKLLHVTSTPKDEREVPGLIISARTPGDNNVEGFETEFGAPMIGVQWHPEAYQTKTARDGATVEARQQSDELMKAFGQAMSAYAAKQRVNAELLDTRKKIKAFNK